MKSDQILWQSICECTPHMPESARVHYEKVGRQRMAGLQEGHYTDDPPYVLTTTQLRTLLSTTQCLRMEMMHIS